MIETSYDSKYRFMSPGGGTAGETPFEYSVPEGYKSYQKEVSPAIPSSWETVSTTLPTSQQFQEEVFLLEKVGS